MWSLKQVARISTLFLTLRAVACSSPSVSSEQDNSSPACPSDNGGEPGLVIRPVLRVSNITVEEFRARHSRSPVQVPIVLENSNRDWFKESDWTREAILKECGDNRLVDNNEWCYQHGDDEWDCHRVRYVDPKLVGEYWAAVEMVDLGKHNLKTIRDLMEFQDTPEGRNIQMHDGSMKELCPPGADRIKVPKYIDRDYTSLLYDQRELDRRDAANPTFFISKEGTGSALHTDTVMERVYVQQLSGRKLWRTFPPSEYWRLYPNLESFDNVRGEGFYPTYFYADGINPDFEKFPLLNGALAFDAILNPGDVLIMPPGWPHQVLNLDDTIMSAANFVDWDGLAKFNEFWRFQIGDYDPLARPEFLLHTAFFFPLDPIPRESEGLNIELEDFGYHHHLARLPVPESVKTWVKRRSTDHINAYRGLGGWPALTLAVRYNFESVVRYLVEEGDADPNVEDAQGYTPLDWAQEFGSKGMLSPSIQDFLKSHGAEHSESYLEEKSEEEEEDEEEAEE